MMRLNGDACDARTDAPAGAARAHVGGRARLTFSIVAVACAGCLALTLAGCGSGSDGGSTASTASTAPNGAATSGAADSAASAKASNGPVSASMLDSSLLDGPVAMSIDNTVVLESDVTDYIQSKRAAAGLSDDTAWAQYLATNDLTPEDIRNDALNSYTFTILMNDAIASEGVTVTDDEVQSHLSQLRDYYNGYASNGWDQMRDGQGYATDDAYAEHLRQSMQMSKLQDKVVGSLTVSDDEVQSYLDAHQDAYAGKRGAFIILPDLDAANAVKALIDNGYLTFQEAALTYSLASNNAYTQAYAASTNSMAADDGTQTIAGPGTAPTIATTQQEAQDALDAVKALYVGDDAWQQALDAAGDQGWLTDEQIAGASTDMSMGGVAYTALADLSAGQVSDPIQTGMGVQLIACTESYDPATDGSSVADMPSDLQDKVRSDALSAKQSDAWNAYCQQLLSDADTTVYAMPSGLPYDVDVQALAGSMLADASSASDAAVRLGASDDVETIVSAASSNAREASDASDATDRDGEVRPSAGTARAASAADATSSRVDATASSAADASAKAARGSSADDAGNAGDAAEASSDKEHA